MTISTEQFIPTLVGASENDGTGDPLRDAFIKINDNFSNVSTTGFNSGNISIDGSIEFTDLTNSRLTLPTYTVASVPATAPDGSVIYVSNGDAGSPTVAVSIANVWKVVALGATIS